jgi:hypothetical protein
MCRTIVHVHIESCRLGVRGKQGTTSCGLCDLSDVLEGSNRAARRRRSKKNNAQLLDLPMYPVPCDSNKQDRCQTRHRHVPVVGLMEKSQATHWRLATLAAHLLDAAAAPTHTDAAPLAGGAN